MTQEDKQLLLADLCARLAYVVICKCLHSNTVKATAIDTEDLSVYYFDCDEWESIEHCKPYLRPLSSMTEEEAKEIATLRGLKNILSVQITDKYIDVIIDDGLKHYCSELNKVNNALQQIRILRIKEQQVKEGTTWLVVVSFIFLGLIIYALL